MASVCPCLTSALRFSSFVIFIILIFKRLQTFVSKKSWTLLLAWWPPWSHPPSFSSKQPLTTIADFCRQWKMVPWKPLKVWAQSNCRVPLWCLRFCSAPQQRAARAWQRRRNCHALLLVNVTLDGTRTYCHITKQPECCVTSRQHDTTSVMQPLPLLTVEFFFFFLMLLLSSLTFLQFPTETLGVTWEVWSPFPSPWQRLFALGHVCPWWVTQLGKWKNMFTLTLRSPYFNNVPGGKKSFVCMCCFFCVCVCVLHCVSIFWLWLTLGSFSTRHSCPSGQSKPDSLPGHE